jgi:hypothetical protein
MAKKNELDPRVMPSTKKTEKAGKKSKISAKPELARVGQRFQASALDCTQIQETLDLPYLTLLCDNWKK